MTLPYSLEKTTYPLYLFRRTIADSNTNENIAKRRQLAIKAGEKGDWKLLFWIIDGGGHALLNDLYKKGYRYPPLLCRLAEVYKLNARLSERKIPHDKKEIYDYAKTGAYLFEEGIKGLKQGTDYSIDPNIYRLAGELNDILAKYETNIAKKVSSLKQAAGYYEMLIKHHDDISYR